MVVNKNWSIAYTGRTLVSDPVTAGSVTKNLTFVTDVVSLTSKDKVSYYVAVVSKEDFENKCSANYLTFATNDLQDVKNLERQTGTSYLRNGSFEEMFDAVDEGGGQYYAIAYGVENGKLTGDYASIQFSTPMTSASEVNTWRVSYKGRGSYTGDDGFIYYEDVIGVDTSSQDSYVVDIASPQYVRDEFGGNLMDYFWSVSDYLWGQVEEDASFMDLAFGDNPQLLNSSWSVSFDRLYPGTYVAYAIGMDGTGFPTGRYSSLTFRIDEETPTAEFSKWLGKWRIGSDMALYENDRQWGEEERPIGYDIEIRNLDSNYEYEILGWEQGPDADDFAKEHLEYNLHTIVATWDEVGGRLVIPSQYITSLEYDGGDSYDDFLFARFKHRQGRETYLYVLDEEGLTIAVGELAPDGQSASIEGQKILVNIDGVDGTEEMIAMQFTELPWDESDSGIYFFNESVPEFPLTLIRSTKGTSAVGGNTPSLRDKVASRPTTRRMSAKARGGASSLEPRRSVSGGFVRSSRPSTRAGATTGVASSRREVHATSEEGAKRVSGRRK